MRDLFLSEGGHDIPDIKKEMQYMHGADFHRITEYSELKEIHKDHQVQLLSKYKGIYIQQKPQGQSAVEDPVGSAQSKFICTVEGGKVSVVHIKNMLRETVYYFCLRQRKNYASLEDMSAHFGQCRRMGWSSVYLKGFDFG